MMKQNRASIRISIVDGVIRALRESGVPGITVSRVHGVGFGFEPYLLTLAPSELKRSPEVAEVDVVCEDRCADEAVTVTALAAGTGDPGDGVVFGTAVERAAKIRTGKEVPEALQAWREFQIRQLDAGRCHSAQIAADRARGGSHA